MLTCTSDIIITLFVWVNPPHIPEIKLNKPVKAEQHPDTGVDMCVTFWFLPRGQTSTLGFKHCCLEKRRALYHNEDWDKSSVGHPRMATLLICTVNGLEYARCGLLR
jgi:hypothetical protein